MKSQLADSINVMDSSSSVFYKRRLFLPFLLSILTLILYSITLSPTINFGDSPELIASAYTLGMSHPPGYPLYSLLGKFFSLIPWSDSIAQRLNFASAFYSAASIFILELLIERSGISYYRTAGIFLACFLALSSTLWSQSVISEVYSLNLFFFSLLLLLTYLWWIKGDARYLLATFFLYGLGLANHHTLLPFAPLLVIFIIAGKRWERRTIKIIPLILFLTLLGASVYMFIPLRSAQAPSMDWGDAETYNRFLDLILRRQFPTVEEGLSFQQALRQLVYFGNRALREFTITGVLLSILGFIRSYKIGRAPFLILLALFIIHGPGTLLVLNPLSYESYKNVEVMIIPSFAIIAIWIAMAASDLTGFCMKKKLGAAGAAILLLIFSGPLIYKTPFAFQENNERHNYFALDYGANIFSSMDKNGVIFVEADTALFPLWYLQFVEGARPDVAVIDVDFLMLPWFKGQIRDRYKNIEINVEDLNAHATGRVKKANFADMLDAFKVSQIESIMEDLIAKRPIYISYEFGPVYRQFKEAKGIYVIDEGLIYKVSKTYEKPAVEKWDAFDFRSLLQYDLKDDPTVKVLATAYSNPLRRKAQMLYSNGKKEEAMAIIKRIKEIEAGATIVK